MVAHVQIIADDVHFDGSPVARIMPTGFPQAVQGFRDLVDGLAEDDLADNNVNALKAAIDEAAGGWQMQLSAEVKKAAKGGLISVEEFDDLIGDFQFDLGCKKP
jgi:hypothetical protein